MGVKKLKDSRAAHLMLVFIFLNVLGFPGSYSRVFGHGIQMAVEYAAFFMEIALMMFWDAGSFGDAKLLELKPKYFAIYFFAGAVTLVSVPFAKDMGSQAVTCARVCVTALFGTWLAENVGLEDLLTDLAHAQAVYVAASAAFPLLFSRYDTRAASYAGDFVGIGGVKNVVADELAFAIISCAVLWDIRREKTGRAPVPLSVLIGTQAVLLIMTHGTGAMAITACCLAYYFIRERKPGTGMDIGPVYVAGSIGFRRCRCLPL